MNDRVLLMIFEMFLLCSVGVIICAILARNKNISLWISLIGILSLIGIIIVFCIHSHKNKCLNCGKKFNSKEKICPYCKTSVSIEEVFGEIKANNIR